MDEGDINAFYGADGELYYQRWDGQQWSAPARMLMESIEVLCLKSRIKRLEEAIKPIIEIENYPDHLMMKRIKDIREAYYADGPDVG